MSGETARKRACATFFSDFIVATKPVVFSDRTLAVTSCDLLFLAQGSHGVDANRAAGRDPAGK